MRVFMEYIAIFESPDDVILVFNDRVVGLGELRGWPAEVVSSYDQIDPEFRKYLVGPSLSFAVLRDISGQVVVVYPGGSHLSDHPEVGTCVSYLWETITFQNFDSFRVGIQKMKRLIEPKCHSYLTCLSSLEYGSGPEELRSWPGAETLSIGVAWDVKTRIFTPSSLWESETMPFLDQLRGTDLHQMMRFLTRPSVDNYYGADSVPSLALCIPYGLCWDYKTEELDDTVLGILGPLAVDLGGELYADDPELYGRFAEGYPRIPDAYTIEYVLPLALLIQAIHRSEAGGDIKVAVYRHPDSYDPILYVYRDGSYWTFDSTATLTDGVREALAGAVPGTPAVSDRIATALFLL